MNLCFLFTITKNGCMTPIFMQIDIKLSLSSQSLTVFGSGIILYCNLNLTEMLGKHVFIVCVTWLRKETKQVPVALHTATLPSQLLPLFLFCFARTSISSSKLAPTLLSAITSRLTKSRSHSPQSRSSSKDAPGAMGQAPSKKSKKAGKDKLQEKDKEEDVVNTSPEGSNTPPSIDVDASTPQGSVSRTTGAAMGSSFVEQTTDATNGSSLATGASAEPNANGSPPTSGSHPPGPSNSCVVF